MNYLIIANNQADNYRGYAKSDSNVLLWKSIDPIEVESPANKSVLPAKVLDDEDFKEAFPQLDALPQENESEIIFKTYDLDEEEIVIKSFLSAPIDTTIEITNKVIVRPLRKLWLKIKAFFKKIFKR